MSGGAAPPEARPSLAARLLILPVRAYKRWVSPLLPPACRYQPTCSVYMMEALRTHGALVGLWLGLRRLARCHPWGGHGWDPVPPPRARACADPRGDRKPHPTREDPA